MKGLKEKAQAKEYDKAQYHASVCDGCGKPNSHVSGRCQACRTIECGRCGQRKVVKDFNSKFCGYCKGRLNKERIDAAK